VENTRVGQRTDYEKLMLMRFRLLNAKDKEDIVEQIRKKIERT
jgi:hypothetical protein